jgi:hypothetical protein
MLLARGRSVPPDGRQGQDLLQLQLLLRLRLRLLLRLLLRLRLRLLRLLLRLLLRRRRLLLLQIIWITRPRWALHVTGNAAWVQASCYQRRLCVIGTCHHAMLAAGVRASFHREHAYCGIQQGNTGALTVSFHQKSQLVILIFHRVGFALAAVVRALRCKAIRFQTSLQAVRTGELRAAM